MGWVDLGTGTPLVGQWLDYDDSVNGETFRLTLIPAVPGVLYKTYCLIRMAWIEPNPPGPDGIFQVTNPKRYWPQSEPLVMDFSLPIRIKELYGGVVWYPQVQKFVWRRFRGGQTNDGAWSLKIEELV